MTLPEEVHADRSPSSVQTAIRWIFEWDLSADRIECWNAEDPGAQIECYPLREWLDDLHHDDVPVYDAIVSRAVLAGQTGWSAKYRARDVEGNWRLYHEDARLRCNARGRIERIVGTIEDVTETRTVERHYRLLADHVTDIVSLHEIEGRLLYVSPSVLKLLGYTDDVTMRITMEELIHPRDLGLIQQMREKHSRGESTTHIWRCRTAAGPYIWTETTTQPVRDETGQIRTKVCVTRNIEERKRAESALLTSEAKLRELAEAIPGVVYGFEISLDGTCRLSFLSRRAPAMFGLSDASADEWAAFFWQHLVPEDAQRMLGLLEQARQSALPIDIELRLQFPHEEVRWYRNFARPVPATDGGVTWYGVALDITEPKRAEREQQARAEQLEAAQRLESLGVLAGGIAHDFNNLLTPVIAFAELARNTVRDPLATARSLDRIEEAARQAVDLCRQMLLYAGRGRSRLTLINLRDVILQLRVLFQHSVSKAAQVSWELADDLPPVLADAGQIRQVVMNLLLNASEALPGGVGNIVIQTQLATATSVRPEGLVSHGDLIEGRPYAVLSVTDDGVGMTTETAQRIFEPFFSTKFVGRGLGLAAVLGILRGHSGAIALTTTPDRGTTFSVYLPLSAQEVTAGNPPLKTPVQPVGGRRVLIIDDEAIVRRSAQQLLESLGVDSCTASDDVAALETIRTSTIDGVLLDLTMPGIDGLELAERLRAVCPQLPIILMSGYSLEEMTDRFREGRFSAFLPKPFSRREMAETLQRVLTQ